jgi:hypothetical protein
MWTIVGFCFAVVVEGERFGVYVDVNWIRRRGRGYGV